MDGDASRHSHCGGRILGAMLTCHRCKAPSGIAVPFNDAVELVCTACHARQPRRDYEVARLQFEMVQGRRRAAEVERGAVVDDPTVCPSCGAERFTNEYGCGKCEHGRRSFLTRHGQLVPVVLFFVLFGGGVSMLFSVGRTAQGPGGIALNLALIGTGAFLAAFGVRAIRSPTTLQIADAETDTFGMWLGKNRRNAAADQGHMVGALCLILGAAALVFGIVAGLAI